MENFKKEVSAVIDVLKDSYSEIDYICKDEGLIHLKNKLLREIDRQITTLSIQNNLPYETKFADSESQSMPGEPLRKIMGRVIEPKGTPAEKQLLSGKPVQATPIAKSAQEVEAEEFKEKAVELYPKFNTIENEQILNQFDEMIIRAVGKLAGLPVSESHPKKVDVKFLDQIKDAIQKKNELEAESKKGAANVDTGNASEFDDDELNDDDLNGVDFTQDQSADGSIKLPGLGDPSNDNVNVETQKQLAGEDTTVKKAVVDGTVNEINASGSDGKGSKKSGDKTSGKSGETK